MIQKRRPNGYQWLEEKLNIKTTYLMFWWGLLISSVPDRCKKIIKHRLEQQFLTFSTITVFTWQLTHGLLGKKQVLRQSLYFYSFFWVTLYLCKYEKIPATESHGGKQVNRVSCCLLADNFSGVATTDQLPPSPTFTSPQQDNTTGDTKVHAQ